MIMMLTLSMVLFNSMCASLVLNTKSLQHTLRRTTNAIQRPRTLGGWQGSKSGYIQDPRAFSRRFLSNDETETNNPSYLNLNVGGLKYTIDQKLLLKFPDISFLDKRLKSEWQEGTDAAVEIPRDGALFKFVYDYMFYGKLPRDATGVSLLGNEMLTKVKEEAEFYHLPGLAAECKELLDTCEMEQRIKRYATMLDEFEEAKSAAYYYGNHIVYRKPEPGSLLFWLRASPCAPAWVTGTLRQFCHTDIFKSTTVQNVNVTELLAFARPSPFGRGSETILDKNVRDSMEIPASQLCDLKDIIDYLDISSLGHNMRLKLKPYKLVIYQEGGHFDNHRDTVRDKRHIGTLVLTLNSEYGGGELEVCHGEQTLVVTGALNWVAMYGDCVHTIRPVTSGTRVSLIFDIWNESDELESTVNQIRTSSKREEDVDGKNNENDKDDGHYEEEGDEEEDEEVDSFFRKYFWERGWVNTGFWRGKESPKKRLETASSPAPTLGLDNVWNQIYLALDKELEKYSTVSICLGHLYPACQVKPDFLKGEDAKLYQMLKDKYSLGLTTITISRISYLYHTDIEDSVGYSEFGPDQLFDRHNNALFVPNAPHPNSILHYIPGAENTANEPLAEELVYLVAALVVRKQ